MKHHWKMGAIKSKRAWKIKSRESENGRSLAKKSVLKRKQEEKEEEEKITQRTRGKERKE